MVMSNRMPNLNLWLSASFAAKNAVFPAFSSQSLPLRRNPPRLCCIPCVFVASSAASGMLDAHEAPGVNCEAPGSSPRSAPKPPARPGSSPRRPCPLRQVGERSEWDFASATGASATQKRSLRNAHPPAFAAPGEGIGCWQDGDAAQQFR